ncbi:MAG: fucose isomerase [Defluviitaleaceae bacterium]|nr:fucose isomerase [Defluviitaleaceae bacterium]
MKKEINREITIRLGVVPVKRGPGFTSAENALITKNNAFSAMKNLEARAHVELINIDSVVPDGIATSPDQVSSITDHLKANKVDAIFIIHTDFGSEEVIAKVGKEMGLPLLLWGERDDAPSPEGIRIRDTQCGIFASGKVLSRFGVPFTYIENCYATDDAFIDGVDRFCRVAAVIKIFRGMKILKIGDRPSSFLSVMANEEELLHKFGIEVTPMGLGKLYSKCNKLKDSPEIIAAAGQIGKRIACGALGEEKTRILAAMIEAIRQEMDDIGAAAASLECWSSMGDFFGFVPCQVIGELTAMGYPVSCEGDICGAVTSAMLHGADYNKRPSFFADLTIRHPSNDNAELLWHCGPFPQSLMKPEEVPSLDDGGRGQWRLKDGELTIARFDGHGGEYSMFLGNGKTTDGPKSTGTYVWMEVNDWVKWERKLVEGPYIHHVSGIYGDFTDVLKEACKYISGLKADEIEN